VSDIPVLLLSGAYDPVTPPDWAADTATHLANSRHFEFLGAGHVPSGSDACAARYVAAFFDDPDPANLAPPDCPLFLEPADFSSVDW
jgi:pimeloyl-ACP methyl ester carboxylesterase